MVLLVERKTELSVLVDNISIGHIKGVQWSGGFNQSYNECKVILTQLPEGFDNDLSLEIIAGNGTNFDTRFKGVGRSPVYNLDGTVTIQGFGQLASAYFYQNSEDPRRVGGLQLFDLMGGATTTTDELAVVTALNKAGLVFASGNIGGTGITFGTITIAKGLQDSFMWQAGDTPTSIGIIPGAGESLLDYIHRWDQISAVHPGPFASAGLFEANSPNAFAPTTSAIGFYRTYETLRGVIVRTLIGGRPHGTPTIATPFTEGVDIRYGQITRGYPRANRFVSVGFDDGSGAGPKYFASQSSNPYMPSTLSFTAPPITSPMIAKSAENDYPNEMSCEKITYAMEPDLNRIIVAGTITTGRDDYVSHGATILLQGPGGAPNKLGTGENVWIQATRGSATYSGFVQEFEILGGGFPDDFLPLVAQ